MIHKKIIAAGVITVFCIFGGLYRYRQKKQDTIQQLFVAEHPSRIFLAQRIKATGVIEAKDVMKIGSLVPGVVKRMYVDENDFVTQNQLLAEIDDGLDDTEVRASYARLRAAYNEFAYQKNHYKRNLKLYEKNFLSENERERLYANYQTAYYNVLETKAIYDQKALQFKHKRIVAPEAGLVIAKISTEGETVTLASPPTLLYMIAKNLSEMEIKIDIDETSITLVAEAMAVELVFDAYPDRIFSGSISSLRHAPVTQGSATSYKAIIAIDNSGRLFRPGMNVTATIIAASAENVLSVPGYVFSFKRENIKDAAHGSGYAVLELDDAERQALRFQENMKTVWLVKDKKFIETPVRIGINNAAFFEIVAGITDSDQVIVDVAEPDAMKEFMGRFFKKGL